MRALERVEDLARVLPGIARGSHNDRDEAEPGAREDHLAVDRGRRQVLDVANALQAQRRPHLGREVGDLGGVEAVRGAHSIAEGGQTWYPRELREMREVGVGG